MKSAKDNKLIFRLLLSLCLLSLMAAASALLFGLNDQPRFSAGAPAAAQQPEQTAAAETLQPASDPGSESGELKTESETVSNADEPLYPAVTEGDTYSAPPDPEPYDPDTPGVPSVEIPDDSNDITQSDCDPEPDVSPEPFVSGDDEIGNFIFN